MADTGFRLTAEDRAALGAMRSRRGRWSGVVVSALVLGPVAVLVLVLAVFVVDVDALPWWVLVLTGAMVVQLVWTVRPILGGSGGVARVLAGAGPTVVVTGRMAETCGDDPFGWSMGLDEPVNGERYVYVGDADPAWLLTEGARVRLRVFGRGSVHGVAVVESIMDGRRHWKAGVTYGRARSYVRPPYVDAI